MGMGASRSRRRSVLWPGLSGEEQGAEMAPKETGGSLVPGASQEPDSQGEGALHRCVPQDGVEQP